MQVFEGYRKFRGSLRFMLGNVHDFDPTIHSIPHASLPLQDRALLHRLRALTLSLTSHYVAYNFAAAYRELAVFLATDLSAQYFELGKDRLYIRGTGDFERRSCQTVLHAVLCALLPALAPITPHMCEDAWGNLAYPEGKAASVFQAGWPSPPEEWAMGEADLKLVQVRHCSHAAADRACAL